MVTTPWSALIVILHRLQPRAAAELERWVLRIFLASGSGGTLVRNVRHGARRPSTEVSP